jgi:cysteine desulfurase
MKTMLKYRNIGKAKRPLGARIYLDYAASTPVDSRVAAAMKPYFSEKFGNPGSVHSFGQEAIAALDASRETIAKAIGAEFREMVFTGSATEANNLALRGVVRGAMSHEPRVGKNPRTFVPPASCLMPRVIISAVEHESVLETARELEKEGVEVIYLPVNKNGAVNLRALKASLNDRTVVVSVMYANNEIGTIQPIAEIAEIISDYRNAKLSKSRNPEISKYPFFHTDAAQAFQFLDCGVKKLGVDMMTLSAHKIYGPKGVGCLYMRQSPVTDSRPLATIITGGGQEFGMRSGTENVPSIVGFAKAVELSSSSLVRANKRIGELRDHLWRGIKSICPKTELNGSAIRVGRSATIPGILNVYFPGREAQDILTRLDLRGIAASSGSACRSRALETSHVIMALGYSKERAKASVRFSLGRPTTKNEIDAAVRAMKNIS